MSILKQFKPNLIPNNPKSVTTDFDKIILKNGGYDKYLVLPKKDGCRMELIDGRVLSRALKPPGSRLVIERFQPLADLCQELNIVLEGEFYCHGMKFNAIFRFFSKSDVTAPEYESQLRKEQFKNPEKFYNEYDGHEIDFLTVFHENLKFHIFDGIVIDRPDLVGYEERMQELYLRLTTCDPVNNLTFDHVLTPSDLDVFEPRNLEELNDCFEYSLKCGYEGLVLIHKEHKYKFGRNSLNEGTLLKMKEDSLEYDGVILNVLEATSVKEGVERTIDNLGYSETSKKKGDRETNGLAKGFLVSFENKGTFIVGLNGFDNEAKTELLQNKEQYIGRHFKYTAMQPVKDFPRHAFFKCWRDAK